MSKVDEKILRKKVAAILKSQSDDDTVSLKTIREALEKDLGVSLSSQKDVLKTIIKEEMNKNQEEEEEESNKRKHNDSDNEDEPSEKKQKSSHKITKADNGDLVVFFTDKKRITVNEFKKSKYVHIREYYEDKPTKKGVAMSRDEWTRFKTYIDTIDEMMNM
ncbi:predicted protein [Naegleria gruberi]|uniref:Predicted protein n=1 Tax=Naegleria gruberi TaxID=5762 RepID=D2VTA2_NAEGR|nr:uncharacterized protein NAEGRDRAFT_72228 [Naegleria gruberi]EFC39822.1 predicted protein [Naegleria gruberi]|eukprot:XP_002672566.1 predicted protein [Naegleria gruberi strain NEG-M]